MPVVYTLKKKKYSYGTEDIDEVLKGLAPSLVRFKISTNKILNINVNMKSTHWQQKEGPEITEMKFGTSVMEDLLALAERLCTLGQGQELLGAVFSQLKTQRRPRTKSYQFFLVMRPTDTIVQSIHLSTESTIHRNTCIDTKKNL